MVKEKIEQVKSDLEKVCKKIEKNSGYGEKAQKELKELCNEKTRLISLLNYLQSQVVLFPKK